MTAATITHLTRLARWARRYQLDRIEVLAEALAEYLQARAE